MTSNVKTLIFAQTYKSAKEYADSHDLGRNDWIYASGEEALHGLTSPHIVKLPGYYFHPNYRKMSMYMMRMGL